MNRSLDISRDFNKFRFRWPVEALTELWYLKLLDMSISDSRLSDLLMDLKIKLNLESTIIKIKIQIKILDS